MISVFWSSLAFLGLALLFKNSLAGWLKIDPQYISYTIWILVLDALVVVPFCKLRANQRPMKYALIKIGNVMTNLLLNVFFLVVLPKLAVQSPESFCNSDLFRQLSNWLPFCSEFDGVFGNAVGFHSGLF